MTKKVDHEFLARDAFRSWTARIRTATSIVVFTPFFDRALVDLLAQASARGIPSTVVTDLSPASGALDYRAQLLAGKQLLHLGIAVRSLARLHAKVLLTNEGEVALGSQNFTRYARRSKETTYIAPQDLAGSRLVRVLHEWLNTAEPVTGELLDLLLSRLKVEIAAAGKAKAELLTAFDAALLEFKATEIERLAAVQLERARTLTLARGIAAALDFPSARTPRRIAYASLEDVYSVGRGEWYESLVAYRGHDLTSWVRPNREVLDLVPKNFYPIILNPSGRMGFARVNPTRITYVWSSVKWGASEVIGSRRYWLTATFPRHELETANMILAARPYENSPLTAQLMFRVDGREVLLTDARVQGRPTVGWAEESVEECLTALVDVAERQRLVSRVLATYHPHRVGIDKHNAENFFARQNYSLRLVEVEGRPLLVASAV